MEKLETPIEGLFLLKNVVFKDDRGIFHKPFSRRDYELNHLDCDFLEFYYSINCKKSLRGMHFQNPPMDHTKLVYVSMGIILDVVLDIRSNSESYGKYYSTVLNAKDGHALYIPRGFAHGFLALEDETIVNYAQTSCYSKEYDAGIRFDSFGFNWGIADPIISDRDMHFVAFKDFITYFC